MAQATIDDVEERQALLNQTSDRDYGEAQTTTSEPVMSRKDYVSVAMLFLIYGMVDLSDKLTDLGGNEIIEGIICRMVHGSVDNPLTDPRCKDSTVQAQMSRIIGWVYSIATIPCILTTVTWGLAAEKYGRRPVLMLSVLGLTLCNATMLLIYRLGISIYWVWAAALLTVVGGGYSVTTALTYTMLSDVLPQSYRANAFMYLGATPVVFGLVSGPLGYALMQNGHWITACVGIGAHIVTCVLCLVLPESWDYKAQAKDFKAQAKDLAPSDSDSQPAGIRQKVSDAIKQTLASFRSVLFQDKTLGMLTFSTIFADLGVFAALFLMQYMTKQLNMSWAEVNLLLTVRNVAKLTLSSLVLPAIGSFLARSGQSTVAKDLWIARGCAIAFALGSYGIGFAKSLELFIPILVLYSCYNGYWSALPSVLSQVAGDDKRAVTFTVVGWMDNCGRLVAGPSLAWAYKIGLKKGGVWNGLPFDVAGVFITMVVVVLFLVKTNTLKPER